MPKLKYGKTQPAKRTTRTRSKTQELDRLRIYLNGHHSTADLRHMLNQAVDELEDLGITHVGTKSFGCALFVKLSNADGIGLADLGPNNNLMDENITISEPRRSAAEEYGL